MPLIDYAGFDGFSEHTKIAIFFEFILHGKKPWDTQELNMKACDDKTIFCNYIYNQV